MVERLGFQVCLFRIDPEFWLPGKGWLGLVLRSLLYGAGPGNGVSTLAFFLDLAVKRSQPPGCWDGGEPKP